MKIALIGASPENLAQAKPALAAKYPHARLFFHHGFFEKNSATERRLCKRLYDFDPDLLFVCMGTPLQEAFIERNRAFFPRAFAIGLGGSIDVWSGARKRAPRAIQKLCLEWLWRIAQDPKKLAEIPNLLEFAQIILSKRSKRDFSLEKRVDL